MRKSSDEKPGNYLYSCIFGKANAGKTSLIKRFVSSEFPNKYIATTKYYPLAKHIAINNNEFELCIFDTAGSKSLQTSDEKKEIKNLINENKIDVFIFTIALDDPKLASSTNSSIENIKKEIQDFKKEYCSYSILIQNIPIVLAFTKDDQKDQNNPELKSKLQKCSAKFLDFGVNTVIFNSAKEDKNVTETFISAAQLALQKINSALKSTEKEGKEGSDLNPKRFLFTYPQKLWTSSILIDSSLLLAAISSTTIGLSLFLIEISTTAGLLLLASAATLWVSFIYGCFTKKEPFNQSALMIGVSIGIFSFTAAGFYLGSLIPGIGNILGAFLGMSIGATVVPLLSLAVAQIVNQWSDPEGILTATKINFYSSVIGLGLGIGSGFLLPFGPLITGLVGAALFGLIGTIIGAIKGKLSKKTELTAENNIFILGESKIQDAQQKALIIQTIEKQYQGLWPRNASERIAIIQHQTNHNGQLTTKFQLASSQKTIPLNLKPLAIK